MPLSYYFYIFLAFLELINNSKGRPRNMKLPSSNLSWFEDMNETKTERRLDIKSIPDKLPPDKDDEIIFPDSAELEPDTILRIDSTPSCAESDTFCENVEFYPYQYVNTIVHKLDTKGKFFYGVDEEISEFEERVGGFEEDKFVCSAVQRLIFPKIARNKNNEWKYVVNQEKKDGFVQGFRIESCRNQGGPCDMLEVPMGFKASCKQKYIYRRMLALTEDGNPIADTFLLPSACCCSYKRDMDFLTRFGDQMTPPKVKSS